MRAVTGLAITIAVGLLPACSDRAADEPAVSDVPDTSVQTGSAPEGRSTAARPSQAKIAYLQTADVSGARQIIDHFFRLAQTDREGAAELWCEPAQAATVLRRLKTFDPYKTNNAAPLPIEYGDRAGSTSIVLQILTPDNGNIVDGTAYVDLRGETVEDGWCIAAVHFQPPPQQLPVPMPMPTPKRGGLPAEEPPPPPGF